MSSPLVERLSETLRGIRRFRKKEIFDGLLYRSEFCMLIAIHEYCENTGEIGIKPSVLTEILGSSISAVSKQLKAVEEKGYIERSYSKKDKRVVYISLTQKGIELLKKAKKERNSDIETIIRKLGKEKTEFLIEILEEISAIMDEESKVEKKHD